MKFSLTALILGLITGSIIYHSFKYVVSSSEKIEYKRDSIITEQHREQRMLDWKSDSIQMEFEKKLRIVIDKANKYDSIMQYEKKAINIRK